MRYYAGLDVSDKQVCAFCLLSALLDMLSLKGRIVTADAMHTKKHLRKPSRKSAVIMFWL